MLVPYSYCSLQFLLLQKLKLAFYGLTSAQQKTIVRWDGVEGW